MTKHNKTTLPIYLESSKTRKLITKEPVHPKQHGDLEDPWEMKSKFKIIKKKFDVKKGMKLRIIQVPMQINFSLWQPNPEN